MRACSHQCFKRSPHPVPAAVWVLLGKLAMACKLGTPSPHPQLAPLFHALTYSKLNPWRLFRRGAGHLGPTSVSTHLCALGPGRIFCFMECREAFCLSPEPSARVCLGPVVLPLLGHPLLLPPVFRNLSSRLVAVDRGGPYLSEGRVRGETAGPERGISNWGRGEVG